MKTDPSFHLVAAVILAGLILAVASPSKPANDNSGAVEITKSDATSENPAAIFTATTTNPAP